MPHYYMRKPFYVDAEQVTEENLEELSEKHNLDIRTAAKTGARYLKVKVLRPLNDRQTKAFVGDWLLVSENGYKVYTQAAFEKNFVKVSTSQMLDLLETEVAQTEARLDELIEIEITGDDPGMAAAIHLVKTEPGAVEIDINEL
jgi:hypothetical protein